MPPFGKTGRGKFRLLPAALLVAAVAAVAIGVSAWVRLRAEGESSSHSIARRDAVMALPRVMLWAWERPVNLRFIDSRTTGVAFLAGTVEIHSAPPIRGKSPVSAETAVVFHPRLQPLAVPPGTALMAVVRIETPNDLWHRPADGAAPPETDASARSPTALYSKAERLRVAGMIAATAGIRGVRAVQVDYDATWSERPFYRRLLEDVRARLPRTMPLSITALASWCIGDPWLDSLPAGTVAEAVPMLFRMGPDAASVAAFLRQDGVFRAPVCRGSLGVSTDEPFSQALLRGRILPLAGGKRSRRVYVFSSRAWTRAQVGQILREVDQWDAGSPASR